MEIDRDTYMKFKHAYVVGGVNGSNITLLDPHGKVVDGEERRKLYSPVLVALLEGFYSQLAILEEELVASDYTGFSVAIREKLEGSIVTLDGIEDKVEGKAGKGYRRIEKKLETDK